MPKLLLISMPSLHFTRWVSNLEDSGFDLYWFDILNRGEIKEMHSITQFSNWRKRKRKIFKGEYTLSKKLPKAYGFIEPLLQTTITEKLSEIINNIKPDIVHSFQMQDCTYPILKTMKNFKDIPWIYSCWGSDLFFYKDKKKDRQKLIRTLARVNYFHADNQRDYTLAKSLGFNGELFGILPGGGGYHLSEMNAFNQPLGKRNVILVKGYQHHFGRAMNVMEALLRIKEKISRYEIVVFGAHEAIFKYQNDFENIRIYDRNELGHEQLFHIMSHSKLYVGNSISDGIPNTLLEAMIMGVFPIQSNPGNVTAEIITNGVNGFLINDPYNVEEIKNHILDALSDDALLKEAQKKNSVFAEKHLEYSLISDKIEFSYLSTLKN